MKYFLISFFSLSCALAQLSFPVLSDRVATDSVTLNVAAINTAGRALEAKNIEVLVIVLETPTVGGNEEAWQYFEEAISYYGFVEEGHYLPNFFTVFVQLPPSRQDWQQGGVWLRYGRDYKKLLEYSVTGVYLVEELGRELSRRMVAAIKSNGDYATAINQTLLRFADIVTVCTGKPVGQCGYDFAARNLPNE
jgi:hypothetical protein